MPRYEVLTLDPVGVFAALPRLENTGQRTKRRADVGHRLELTAREFVTALSDPTGSIPWSAATGPALVLVDGADGASTDEPPGCESRLAVEAPVVAAGVGIEAADRVGAHCDLLVTDDADPALAGIVASPHASVALAQLTRRADQVEPSRRALVAESLAYAALQAGPEHRRWLDGHRPDPVDDRPDAVRFERSGDAATIVLSRPAVHNALGAVMRAELTAALEMVAADPDLRPVTLRGTGPSFCSGGDLREFGRVEDPVTAHLLRTTGSPAFALVGVRDRVTAEVHGGCVGAGVELASLCGRVVADRETTFRLPEVGMGLIPGVGGTVGLPARLGRHRANWLMMSGEAIDAPTALDWGLVDEIG